MLIDFQWQIVAGPTGIEQSPGRGSVCVVRALATETGTRGRVTSSRGLSQPGCDPRPLLLRIQPLLMPIPCGALCLWDQNSLEQNSQKTHGNA